MLFVKICLVIVIIAYFWTAHLDVAKKSYLRALDRIHNCFLCLPTECDTLQLDFDSLKPIWIVILSPFVWSQKSCFKKDMYKKLVSIEEICKEKNNETY